MKKSISLLFIAVVLFISCSKEGSKGEPGLGKEKNEFILDGASYDFSQTTWIEAAESVVSTENSKHDFLFGYENPGVIKEGAKILSSKDVSIALGRTDVSNVAYISVDGKVSINILKILPAEIPLGPRGLVGTFSGEFESITSDEKKNISGQFHTTRKLVSLKIGR